ncbi:TRAP-type C4-dicarboxylate transport system permease small subunit [Brachybacterium muris]|nr:TRAP transporter small permease [Brachybacterium muris]MBM7502136.1 TRAP-type C4-dicarboxylate transport system permease small subunit [Brachybacterium muris]
MTVLVMIQIVTRYALNQPTAWTEELVRYALIWTSFLAASYAFLERRHMALSILPDRLSAPARRGLTRAVDVLVLLFAVLVLGIGGVMLVLSSLGDMSALLGISRGAVYAIVPISGLMIALAQVTALLDPSADGTSSQAAAATQATQATKPSAVAGDTRSTADTSRPSTRTEDKR